MKSHNHYALCPECERRLATIFAAASEVLRAYEEDRPLRNKMHGLRLALSGAAQPRGEPCGKCGGLGYHECGDNTCGAEGAPCPPCGGSGRAP